MVDSELLDILRCPYCVSGETRKPGDDPDCGRKYPIRDDIPVMLIEEGDRWVETGVEDLPVPPPPSE